MKQYLIEISVPGAYEFATTLPNRRITREPSFDEVRVVEAESAGEAIDSLVGGIEKANGRVGRDDYTKSHRWREYESGWKQPVILLRQHIVRVLEYV